MRAVVVLGLGLGLAGPAGAAPPTADAIADETASAYQTAGTYEDAGTIETAVGGRLTRIQTFATAFARDDRFRLDVDEAGDAARRYTLWSNGRRTLTKLAERPMIASVMSSQSVRLVC